MIDHDQTDSALGQPDGAHLKLALLRRAAQIVATADPLSMTFRAAARILEIKLHSQFDRVLGRSEQTEAVSELINSLREVVQVDPDTAGSWVSALRALRAAEDKMLDPTKWVPSPSHWARALAVLQCDASELMGLRIDENGELLARRIGCEFVKIPVDPA